MNTIDRAAVLALLDAVIADPGPSPAAGALAHVLRMQVEQLPVLSIAPPPTLTCACDTVSTSVFVPVLVHIRSDGSASAITAGVAQ